MSTAVIILLLIVTVVLLPRSRGEEVAIALLVHLLGSRMDHLGPRAARGLMRAALVALPSDQREDQFDEWVDHLRNSGDDGLHALIVAVGLVARGVPRLAVRARTRQVFDLLVRFEPHYGIVVDGGSSKASWSHGDQTRIRLMAVRYIGVVGRWGTGLLSAYSVMYDIEIEPDQDPIITREVYTARNHLQRTLVWLAARLGCQASEHRKARDTAQLLLEAGLLIFVDSLSHTDNIFDTAVRKRNGLFYSVPPR